MSPAGSARQVWRRCMHPAVASLGPGGGTVIGQQISHYRLTERVKEGGMGTVYKAEDLTLQRTVAVKVIKPSHHDPRVATKRFLREAQAVSKVRHPNVITLYDVVQKGDANFLIMEYISGPSLRDRLGEGPVGPREGVRIACEVASALGAAHDLGVVHRDIKPENIMMEQTGLCKVLDFGVAHLVDQSTLTGKGRIIGTLPYMAPEQIRGGKVDARADIYALGVLLFEMLTGTVPFSHREETALFYQIMNVEAPPLGSIVSDLPAGIEAIVSKALAKAPAKRYQTTAEMLHALEIVRGRITEAAKPSTGRLYAKSLARRRAVRWAVVVGALVGVVILSQTVGPQWMSAGRLRAILGGGSPGGDGNPPLRAAGADGLPVDKHILVLPFMNVGDSPANQVLCDGLMEILASMLTQMEQFEGTLWVIPASEVRERGLKSAGEAQRAFGVNLVITGSAQRLGDLLRLTLNLVAADTQRQLSSSVINAPLADVSVLQGETVARVADMLGLELPGRWRDILTAGGTRVPGAYEYYLQGSGYLQRYESMENLDNAVRSFEQAVERDDTYALAYAGLGKAFWRKYELTPNADWVEKARGYCNEAIRINDRLAPVHVTLGIIQGGSGRYGEALEEFKRALELDPASFEATLEMAIVYAGLDSVDAAEKAYERGIDLRPGYWGGYSQLGAFYYGRGRFAEARDMFAKVTELTPDNVRGYNNLIAVYYVLGDADRARSIFERSIAIRPNATAYSNMGTLYIYEGKYVEAIPLLEWAIKLGEDDYRTWGNLADSYRYTPGYVARAAEAYRSAIRLAREKLSINPNDAGLRSNLAVYHAKSGRHDEAGGEIVRAKMEAPTEGRVLFNSAIVFELTGRREDALGAVEAALASGVSAEVVRSEPELAELRKDERYHKLIDNYPVR